MVGEAIRVYSIRGTRWQARRIHRKSIHTKKDLLKELRNINELNKAITNWNGDGMESVAPIILGEFHDLAEELLEILGKFDKILKKHIGYRIGILKTVESMGNAHPEFAREVKATIIKSINNEFARIQKLIQYVYESEDRAGEAGDLLNDTQDIGSVLNDLITACRNLRAPVAKVKKAEDRLSLTSREEAELVKEELLKAPKAQELFKKIGEDLKNLEKAMRREMEEEKNVIHNALMLLVWIIQQIYDFEAKFEKALADGFNKKKGGDYIIATKDLRLLIQNKLKDRVKELTYLFAEAEQAKAKELDIAA